MKKIFAYAFVGIVMFIILANAISAKTTTTYPYQYNYVTSSITFDEKGKAVLVASLSAETLSDQAVDEITLRIPYSDVSVWYVKEQAEKRDLIISLYRDCIYPLPYETTTVWAQRVTDYQIGRTGNIAFPAWSILQRQITRGCFVLVPQISYSLRRFQKYPYTY